MGSLTPPGKRKSFVMKAHTKKLSMDHLPIVSYEIKGNVTRIPTMILWAEVIVKHRLATATHRGHNGSMAVWLFKQDGNWEMTISRIVLSNMRICSYLISEWTSDNWSCKAGIRVATLNRKLPYVVTVGVDSGTGCIVSSSQCKGVLVENCKGLTPGEKISRFTSRPSSSLALTICFGKRNREPVLCN